MKKNEILACLKANKAITDYELSIVNKDSRELFYVLDNLEINRAVKVETATIKVYVSNKKTTGSSIVAITAADDKKTLTKKINEAAKKAKQAANQYYPLPEKTINIKETKVSKRNLNDIALNVGKAVMKADKYKNGWINSTEIFVSEFKNEFINSKGVNHLTHSFKIEVECIPTWSNQKEEYELYKFYQSGKIDYKEITKEINDILTLAKYRSEAKTIKDVKIPKNVKVLVQNDMLDVIVYNLVNNRTYRSIYMKDTHYEKGDKMSDNKFTLTVKGSIPGCTGSKKYDGNGIVLKSKVIVKDGIVKGSYGDAQFGYYLKEKNITGNLPVCEIKAKSSSYKKDKHIIIESFSAPQLDEDSGYWGGEVRLARYFDGKKYIPLTGFSISGMIYDDIKKVEFSKEEKIQACYKGPKYMIFRGIEIS